MAVTSRHRLIDFNVSKDAVEAVVKTIEYDQIVQLTLLVRYTDGVRKLISSLLKVLKLVNASFQVLKQISKEVGSIFHLLT